MMPMSIEEAHRFEIPAMKRGDFDREANLLVRYDGFQTANGPIILAMVSIQDLAKITEALEDAIPDGALAQGSAFFRHDRRDPTRPGGLCYVNTNRHDDFLPSLTRMAGMAGLGVLNSVGDLRLMMTPDGTMNPPAIPAFAKLGFETMDITEARGMFARSRRGVKALEALRGITKARGQEHSNDNDDPALPL